MMNVKVPQYRQAKLHLDRQTGGPWEEPILREGRDYIFIEIQSQKTTLIALVISDTPWLLTKLIIDSECAWSNSIFYKTGSAL